MNQVERTHSEGYLTDVRDYWWNQDFISLMAKRWGLNKIKSVLDVGCGVGHWGQMLFPHFAQEAILKGIDPEHKWIEEAKERTIKKGIQAQAEYLLGTAEKIPFPDNTFEMVTCQTVLIHVGNIEIAIKEMLRVLKPGGLIVVSEPNNLIHNLIFNNLNTDAPIQEILDIIRFQLICDRGKSSLGKGFNSSGDIIPQYFNKAGLTDIKIYLSDLADYFIPPYHTQREQFIISTTPFPSKESWEEESKYYKQYFLAGGGAENEFNNLWTKLIKNIELKITAWNKKVYCTAGGEILYLISGIKR